MYNNFDPLWRWKPAPQGLNPIIHPITTMGIKMGPYDTHDNFQGIGSQIN
jgi:hypothetical protein